MAVPKASYTTDGFEKQIGASTTLYGCLSPELNNNDLRGAYLVDCGPYQPSKDGQDVTGELRKQLWDITEKEIQLIVQKF
eukprot:gene21282-27575_t